LTLTGGSAITLSGTFTTPNGPLNVSGGGYTFQGTLTNGVLSGTWTGPSSNGSFSTLVGSSSSVTNYCGTFSGQDSGTWNFTISGTTLSGSYTGTSGSGILTGTVNGNSVSISTQSGGTAQGTISGTNVSGTWMGGSKTGTWMGSSTGC
jgi:hypothetical protein